MTSQTNSAREWLPLRSLTRAVGALVNVSGMNDSGLRREIVDVVQGELRSCDPGVILPYAPHANMHIDIANIVRICADVRGGLAALADAVEMYRPGMPATNVFTAFARDVAAQEPDILDPVRRAALREELSGIGLRSTVPDIYSRANAEPTTADTLLRAVHELARRGSSRFLFRFLEYTAADSADIDSAESLRHWIDENIDELVVSAQDRKELREVRRELTHGPTVLADTPVVQVRLDPDGYGRHHLTARILPDGHTPDAEHAPDDALDRLAAEHWLAEELGRYGSGLLSAKNRPVIEFVLDPGCLNEPVDEWQTVPGGDERFGVRYCTVVRPNERPHADLHAGRWKAVAAAVDRQQAAADVVRWLSSTEVSEDREESAEEDWVWIAVTCPQMSREQNGGAVTNMLKLGTPIALWIRGECDLGRREGLLQEISAGRELDQIPDAVRKRREFAWKQRGAASDPRRRLVLMWDDPTRPPPVGYDLREPVEGVSTQ